METRPHPRHAASRLLPCVHRCAAAAVLFYCLSVPAVARAATYYLNTGSGSDSNPGTSTAPWKTLTKVQSGAADGDTVVIQRADATTYAAKWPTQVSYRARGLQQFAVTWTFDAEYTVGQFNTGDFWVAGPVKIVGIDPSSQAVDGRTMNGSMLNPSAGCNPQGYDSAMPSNPYDPALNVALGVSGSSPLTLAPNSSLISTISIAKAGSIPQLQRAVILTVLSSPAAPNSFRPPYCGTDKTVRFNKSALDYSLLKKLNPVSGTPALSDMEAQFAAPWIEQQGGWTATALRPSLNMPYYGRDMHTAIGMAALMLHLNFTDAQKEKLLVEFVQLGIDLYGVLVNGGTSQWSPDGGQAGGRKWPILFAGLVLHDSAMKGIGAKSGDYLYQNGYGPGNIPPDHFCFGEDDQTFYVAQLDVDATNGPAWKPDSRDAQRIPYSSADLGLPEWAIRHSQFPVMSNKWWPTEYRQVAGPPFHSTALAALLTDGGKAIWNHNAYFDYCDRYMAVSAPTGECPGWRTISAFTANMWDTYRTQCGPVWPAVSSGGPVLSPIGDRQITTSQTLTLTIRATSPNTAALTYSASGLPRGATLSGQTFTWTPTTAQTGTYQVTFTVSDGTHQDSKTITITVTKENSAPVLGAIGNKSVNENQALTFALAAVDADGDTIAYSATNLPAGATLTGPTFSWTPTYNQAGNYNVTLTASDGQAQDSQTIAIAVANIDRPPVLANIEAKSIDPGNPLSFALAATDPDGDSLTYSAGTLPSGATLTGQTFTWTPVSGQGGSYPITFTVSDGVLTDTGTVTITVASAATDRTAPVVAQCAPAPGAIQVALNNLVTLQITDADSGVDAGSVVIRINDNVVYQGNAGVYSSASGRCTRSGTENEYRFIYQPDAPFDFDQAVAVRVAAADRAGNVMSEYQCSFLTEMRAFGKNQVVSPLGGSADSKPVTASDPAGNIWVAWHAGADNRRDIYVAKQPAGSSAFQAPIRLTSDIRDQCNPALAVNATGAVAVVWQDNRSGNWDIYASISWDGRNFSKEARVTRSNRNEISPAVAFDHRTPGGIYVAWQDDRNGNQDIYVASSTNGFATSTESRVTSDSADQTEPDLTIDAANIAYVFWTDSRSGQADIYAAASNAGPWTNMPIVTGGGDQTQPVVRAGAGGTLHLLWVDNAGGNNDIFYASLNGLPGSPVVGIDIIDDSSGADQTAPALVCGADQKVFASWQDWRHAGSKSTDADLYVTELRSTGPRANVFVGDDGTNVSQSDPAIGVDRYGQPYVVWTDNRQITAEIYCATTTFVDPTPVDSKTVLASAGACLGTDPAAIRKIQDVSLVVPPGACQADLRMTISKILGSQVSATALLGSYEFGPSGTDFEQPVTVTIPYAVDRSGSRALPYWYDAVTGAMSQQGITDIQSVYISSGVSALRFRTTHFTPFYLIAADAQGTVPVGSGGTGGCALSDTGGGSPGQLLVPYATIAMIMMILRRRDRRRAFQTRPAACGSSDGRLARHMA